MNPHVFQLLSVFIRRDGARPVSACRAPNDDFVGTAFNLHSRVWFTLSHGILGEIYFPRVDQACTRDFGLIVTDGHQFFSQEKPILPSKVFLSNPECLFTN